MKSFHDSGLMFPGPAKSLESRCFVATGMSVVLSKRRKLDAHEDNTHIVRDAERLGRQGS